MACVLEPAPTNEKPSNVGCDVRLEFIVASAVMLPAVAVTTVRLPALPAPVGPRRTKLEPVSLASAVIVPAATSPPNPAPLRLAVVVWVAIASMSMEVACTVLPLPIHAPVSPSRVDRPSRMVSDTPPARLTLLIVGVATGVFLASMTSVLVRVTVASLPI